MHFSEFMEDKQMMVMAVLCLLLIISNMVTAFTCAKKRANEKKESKAQKAHKYDEKFERATFIN